MYESWYQLPPDPNIWYNMVVDNLTRKIPETPQYIAGMEIQRFDPVLGDADGLVYLMGGIGAIPIIIRQNKLAPLDIMMGRKDEFYPVNEVFLQKLYADNAIGSPSKGPQDDLNMDGPAKRIIPKNLIKSASNDTMLTLKDTVLKSASLMSFFNEFDKDLLYELATWHPEEKVAADKEPIELPKIHFIAKDSDGYFYNGEEINAKTAGALMSQFGISMDERANILINGGIVCVDDRDKTASITAMTNSEVSSIAHASIEASSNCSYFGTVIDANGVPHQGGLVRVGGCLQEASDYDNRLISHPNDNTFNHTNYSRWLFVGKNIYAYQPDINLIDGVPTDSDVIASMLTPVQPTIGATITVRDGGTYSAPITIAMVVKEFNQYQIYDSLGNKYYIDVSSVCYALPPNFVRLPSNDNEAFLTMPGENYTVVSDYQGHFVLKDKELSYTNLIYRLMQDIDLSLEDSRAVANNTLTNGSTKLKIAAAPTKKPVTKKEAPKSKEQQSAEAEQFKLQQQEAAQGQVTGQQQFEQQQQQMQQQQMMSQTSMAPVNFDDMQDVAKLNDPTLMDAYLSGKLVDVNTMGREQMMKISDNLVNAIKSVAKLLYLIRMGKVDYINEEDTTMALSKMGDVVKSVGVSTNQVMN